MRAAKKFTGIIDGKPKAFQKGDPITKAEADELGLAKKPDLTERAKRKPAE